MSLWAEMRRRNVVKVGIAYLTLAWIVIEVTSMAVSALSLPETLNPIVFYLGLIGFPFAIFFAWAFELTPDGIMRAESVDPEKSVTTSTGKRLEHIIVVLLAVAVIFLVWENYIRSPAIEEIAPVEVAAEIIEEEDERPSIAVLPFVNMSPDTDQEYFSDGISEEILNVLAKIPGLHVTSRSSAFAFKGKDLDLTQVADQLGVNHILEGSVRKAGNQVRITAQLIEANSDRHLWSETYDRELVDIFAVQDEISNAIVIVLEEKLMGEEDETPIQKNDIATTNPAAYTAYLQGLQLWKLGGSENADRALELIKQSVSLDANYAPSQSLLSTMYRVRAAIALITLSEGVPLARAAAERAIEVDPNYEMGYVARASIKELFDFDFQGSREDLEHAVMLNPNNAQVFSSLSMNSTAYGNFDQALEEAQKSIALDPMNIYAKSREARVLNYMGEDQEALKFIDITLAVFPEAQTMIMYKATSLNNLGRFEEALEFAGKLTDEAFRPQMQSMSYFGLGDIAAADEALETLIRDAANDSAYQIAEVYGHRGDIENCLKWLDISYDQMDPGMQDVAVSRNLESVRDEPRYLALLEKMGLSPQQ